MRIGLLTTIEAGRINLLSQLIGHYTNWCLRDDMHIVVRGDDGGESVAYIRERMCRPYETIGPYSTFGNIQFQWGLTLALFDWQGWHFNVDSDEFAFPIDYSGFCHEMEKFGSDYAIGRMVDMVAPDGSMPPIPRLTEQPIGEVFTKPVDLTAGVVRAWAEKAFLLRNPLYGHHAPLPGAYGHGLREWPHRIDLLHYKWDSTCRERMCERVAPEHRERFPFWSAYHRLISFMENGPIDRTPEPEYVDSDQQ